MLARQLFKEESSSQFKKNEKRLRPTRQEDLQAILTFLQKHPNISPNELKKAIKMEHRSWFTEELVIRTNRFIIFTVGCVTMLIGAIFFVLGFLVAYQNAVIS